MYTPKFRRNISNVKTSVGYILNSNRDKLFSAKSLQELQDIVKNTFAEASCTAPKAVEIEFKLTRQRSLDSAFIYLQNVMLASAGLATY